MIFFLVESFRFSEGRYELSKGMHPSPLSSREKRLHRIFLQEAPDSRHSLQVPSDGFGGRSRLDIGREVRTLTLSQNRLLQSSEMVELFLRFSANDAVA